MLNSNTKALATHIHPNDPLHSQHNGKTSMSNDVEPGPGTNSFKSNESDYLKALRELARNSCELKSNIYDCLKLALDSFFEVSISLYFAHFVLF